MALEEACASLAAGDAAACAALAAACASDTGAVAAPSLRPAWVALSVTERASRRSVLGRGRTDGSEGRDL